MAIGGNIGMGVGLASSPLRMMGGAGSPSASQGNFFQRSGLGNNFSDFATGLRGITSNFAAGFGKDPAVRAQAAQTAGGIQQQQADSRRQILEWTFNNLNTLAEGIQGMGTVPPALQAYFDKSYGNLQKLGVDPAIIEETRNYVQALATMPKGAAQPELRNFMVNGQLVAVDVNNPQAVAQAQQQGGVLAGDVAQPDTVLPADVEAQKIRIARESRPTTTINIDAKPISEGQAASLGFADRAQNAENIIAELSLAGYQPSGVEETLGNIPGVGNYLISDAKRRHDGAKLDFVTAVLRKESGAAISIEEFEKEDLKYFPQPGDDEQTLADKAARRAQAVANLRREGRPVTGAEATGETERPTEQAGEGTSEQSPIAVKSPEDAAKLKSGTWFKTPDGRVLQRQ